MKKILFISIVMLSSFICGGQTLICWRAESVKYNPSTGEFIPTKRYEFFSEAFFSDSYIRINDAGLYLTIKRISSRNRSNNGIVTVFDVSNDKGSSMVATIVEDKNGIFKLLITQDDHSDVGIVYYIKNR